MTAAEARECRMCGDADIPIDCDGLCQWCRDEVELQDGIIAHRKLAELEGK